jgi:hypothetical protein
MNNAYIVLRNTLDGRYSTANMLVNASLHRTLYVLGKLTPHLHPRKMQFIPKGIRAYLLGPFSNK